MFLSYFSFTNFELQESFKVGYLKIKKLNRFNRFMIFFWLIGPFIYLIERDPADLWLTSISIIFLVRCIEKKEWGWINQPWFICSLIIWLLGLSSSIFSQYSFFSFGQGFVWIRFPIYVAAAQVWLGKDRDIRILMFISLLISMITMFLILILEMYFSPLSEFKVRLTWPYGDKVPGSFIAKVALPVICVLTFFAFKNINKKNLICFSLVILSLFVTYKTGERISFILIVMSCLIIFLYFNRNKYTCILKIVLTLIICILTFTYTKFKNDNLPKQYQDFFNKIPILNFSNSNYYWGAWRGGIQQGLENPIIGLGPSSTRKHCKELGISHSVIGNSFEEWYRFQNLKKNEINIFTGPEFLYDRISFKANFPLFVKSKPSWLPGLNYCGNHPHNFYIQLFAELGVIGLIAGILLYISLINQCLGSNLRYKNCPLALTSFILPLALFFPLQQHGSFFSQWGNLFIWFSIGFAISQTEYVKKNETLFAENANSK